MDAAFLQERIAQTKLQIVAYEDAILAFANNGGIKTYKLDTGQSVTQVTREDLEQMNKTLESLYNRCAMLEARLNGGASIQARPCW